MVRCLFTAALFGMTCAIATGADDEKKPGVEDKKPGAFDRGKVFEKLDANGDGKISREEYKKFAEFISEKMKDAGKGGKLGDKLGQFAEKGFERLDTNSDGFLSKEEFEKAGGLLGGLKGKIDPEKLKRFQKKEPE